MRLNGQVVQSACTADPLFDVTTVIATVSEAIMPLSGNVIVSGTPAGVGFGRKPPLWMKQGNVCEVEITVLVSSPIRSRTRPEPRQFSGANMATQSSSVQARRPGVSAVHSLDRFVFTVPALAEAKRFYTAFGLDVRESVRESAECLDLFTFSHPHCWGTVFANGAPKKLQYFSFGIFADDEPVFRERIAKAGIGCAPHALSDGKGLWLMDPDGIPAQLVVALKATPDAKSQAVPAPPVAPGQGAAPARSRVTQVQPRRLSHALRFTPDVNRMVKFHADLYGIRLSDHSGDGIAFLHSVHGSDHHLVAFAKSQGPGLHHLCWDVGSINEVGCGAEQMRGAGYERGWGVGRHVLGSNYFYYVRDPWNSYSEYSFDIDFVPHNLDWPAADHPAHDSLYVWGPPLPEDFITNFEPA